MSIISAESRGIVRAQLGRLNKLSDDAVPVKLREIIEQNTRCFERGKRLKDNEVTELHSELVRAVPLLESAVQPILYAHYGFATVTNGEHDFEEGTIQVRCLRFMITRRKVSLFDHMIGLILSFHSLCRIVERATLNNPLIEHILQHSPTAAAHLIVLWKAMCSDKEFAIPFGDGLALGRFATMETNAPSIKFVTDKNGYDFTPTDSLYFWRDFNEQIHAGSIRTFLSEDQLNSAQTMLLDEWRRISRIHKEAMIKAQSCLINNDLCDRKSFENCCLETKEELVRLVSSSLWQEVVHQS